MTQRFAPQQFYSSYPSKVILRSGYPTRAQSVSSLFHVGKTSVMVNS